ncbi:MAG: hypothetical protein ACJA2M_000343 [Polaribacter sp.]|jgi:hypothetical protein
MIIGISGKLRAGKDVSADLLHLLFLNKGELTEKQFLDSAFEFPSKLNLFEYRKFADKIKNFVCVLLNCTRRQLENRAFKNTYLGSEWTKYKVITVYNNTNLTPLENKEYKYFGTLPEALDYTKKQRLRGPLSFKNYKIEKVRMTPRILMVLIGTECGRDIIHPNIWVTSLFKDYVKNNNKYPNWLITDLRFPSEKRAIENNSGITIRINRPIKYRFPDLYNKFLPVIKTTGTNKTIEISFIKALKKSDVPEEIDLGVILEHESETGLDNSLFDYSVYNDGSLSDLITKLKIIYLEIKDKYNE